MVQGCPPAKAHSCRSNKRCDVVSYRHYTYIPIVGTSVHVACTRRSVVVLHGGKGREGVKVLKVLYRSGVMPCHARCLMYDNVDSSRVTV